MACRLPGGIDCPEQLWEALLRGDDLVTEVPPDRWDVEEFYDPEPGVAGRSVSKWGAFLDDVAGFDPEFFGISEREAIALDPQHRLLLENSWEAMEHAGLGPERVRESRTGVFVGLTHHDYQLVTADSPEMSGPYGFQDNLSSMASGRIAYALGLRGPALTVDTADSSSLTAVHMACRSLDVGESDMAFAGGAFVMLESRRFLAGTANGQLSPTGRCHAFDIAADGHVLGEGSAVVLLKRLPDALSDGDRILAVIRGTAANQDGHTVNISTPSSSAQSAVYREALEIAGVDAGSVGMVEAHGTGSAGGDAAEYTSLTEVYGADAACALTSVKTNLGHAQSAAGVLGLIKTVLALQRAAIPPNLHFTRLPDDLARTRTRLFVPQEITAWPEAEYPRRAAVSSYGLSGTNVHAIVEQAPESFVSEGDSADVSGAGGQLFALSSTSAVELRRTAGRLADWVDAHAEVALSDLGYTLARRRAHRPVRTAVLASSRAELSAALRQVADAEMSYQGAVGRDDRGPVWVFSGQGSQWAAMGAQLLAAEPVFAATVGQVEPLIAAESGFSVTEALSASQTVTGIDRVQPTLFTMQVALAATLTAYGVRPGAVIGHSLGEVAAAVVAGALSLQDGVRVICRRSRLMSRIAGSGAMASVELPAKQVLSELTARRVKDVVVAIAASPESTIISGAAETLRAMVSAWEQRDVIASEIASDVAVHSPQVEPILEELKEALAELTPMTPQVRFYSTTQFDPREQPACDGRYWVDNLRRTVRFAAAVRAALEEGYRVFAELAAHPLLTQAVEQTAHSLDIPLAVLGGLKQEQDLPHVLGFVADLHSAGAAVDFSVLYPNGRLVDAPLPSWTHRRLWLTPDGGQTSTRGGHTVSVHPLLGQHVRLQEEPEHHVWQAEVGTIAQPWLADHQVRGVAVLPAAAYCEMALTAARTVLDEACEIRDLHFGRPLSLNERVTIGAAAVVASRGVVDFTVETRDLEGQVRRASAVFHAAADEQPAEDVSSLVAAHPRRVEGTDVRNRLGQSGVQYGPAFGGLEVVHTGVGDGASVLAEVALPRDLRSQQDGYGFHPALLDACFQSVAAHPDVQALGSGVLALPLGVRRLRAFGGGHRAHYCYTRVTRADASGIEADLDVLDEHGTVLLAVQGLRLDTGESEGDHKDRILNERLLTIEWRPRQLPALAHPYAGNWLLINGFNMDVASTALTDVLKSHGAQCTTMWWPPHADATAKAAELRDHLRTGTFGRAVVLTERSGDGATDQSPQVGRDYAQQLAHITHELAEMAAGWPRLYVVTRGAQGVVAGDVVNLEQAGLRGLMRVVGVEHPHVRAVQVDMDERTDVELLALQLLSDSEEDETAWRNGEWYTARLCPAPLRPDERHVTDASHVDDGMRLQIRTPGDLETMELVACQRMTPGPGQIEVAITASSINFADVLVAFGRYPAFEGRLPELGTDFAGVVTAVGPDVDSHEVGDHVGGLCADGCWGTFVTCDAELAVTLPAGLSDGQAAAVTTAYATAYHGLHDLAHITGGDKVLIHSATGGVGQAAIAVARAVGAEVFATAGSPERRQMLRDMGIDHVYDSRSIEFAEAIRRDTDGYGVDIVLNTLAGAAQRAGIELLAFGGRFVEIGKGDIYGDTRLGLLPFRRNLAFFGLDLGLLSQTHPGRLRDLLTTVYGLTAGGTLPVPASTHYPLADAATAIRVMSAAEHTGKLVLDVPREGHSQVIVPPAQVPVFRADGAYLVSGGLGGLGLFVAEKMAADGCGRIVLSSRSQPTAEAIHAIERMRAMGADIEVVCGDIADPETAGRLVDSATATGLAVCGVLHLAAVVEDATLTNITDELLERDWAPKVYGAWNLHTATIGQPLDWFCSFSSAAALVGSPGQGAYAAANSWLDAFTRWRRAQGLPATAIAWGIWGQIGRAATLAEGAEVAITPEEGAYALDTLLRHNRTYTGYTPVTGMPWLTALSQRSPFAEAFRTTGQNTAGASSLRTELHELPPHEWPTRLRSLISDQVSLILRRNVDPDRPLAEYGVDSLGALELRTRVESETGIRLTSSDIATTTVRSLAALLCERLTSVEAV